MPKVQLNDTDQAILDILKEGRNAPSNIADRLEFTRQYVQRRLQRLEEHGYVVNIGAGVYELHNHPRKD